MASAHRRQPAGTLPRVRWWARTASAVERRIASASVPDTCTAPSGPRSHGSTPPYAPEPQRGHGAERGMPGRYSSNSLPGGRSNMEGWM